MKHTKGKWKFIKHESHSCHFGNIQSDLGKGENGIMNIRTIDIILNYCGDEEAEANAKLIEAAPEMIKEHELNIKRLEEVKSMLGSIDRNSIKRYIDQIIQSNELVIKKATE